MEPSLFKYIWRHSKREQLLILGVVLASLPFYFLSLDLPKRIVNDAIQGKAFAGGKEFIRAFEVRFDLPGFLGGGKVTLFDGIDVDRLNFLWGLSAIFFVLVMINGWFKKTINIEKGVIGERMLRRMRFDLFLQLLKFRPEEVRLVKPSEAASIIKDEVEPIGGFIGDAFIQPAFLSTQALTALAFILVQNIWLGMLSVLTVAIQAVIVPALRKKQLMLGKERQIASRKLAGKIGELVEGMPAVRTHGTQAYESAEVGGRLGNLFRIRFELYKRKFMVKYLNNLLAQLTPLMFYTIGGYFALKGTLDVGQLVAVIAAYKDIPPPVKELIDWDQQRNDVTIKYEQVVEQFSPSALPPCDPPPATPLTPLDGKKLAIDGLTVTDGRGSALLESASAHVTLPAHVALLGGPGSGREIFARAAGRQLTRYDGTVKIGESNLLTMDPDTATRLIAFAGSEPALFPTSIRENVAYGLRYRIPELPGDSNPAELRRQSEARRTGNPVARAEDDWFAYDVAGVRDMQALDHVIVSALRTVGLGDDIYRFGLSARIDPARDAALAAELVTARAHIHERLEAENKTRLIEPFDPDTYNANGSVGENLLFGVTVAQGMTDGALLSKPENRAVLRQHDLRLPLANMGVQIAETMLEIFVGLPPGHALFERYSFINANDLPAYEEIVTRWRNNGKSLEALENTHDMLANLALGYVEPRHRLGLLSEDLKGRIVAARKSLHEAWRAAGASDVEIYHPERFCSAAPVRDNLLFGRVGFGIAGANETIAELLQSALADLKLEEDIYRIGLDYQVGPGGKLLFATQRAGIDLARCLLRRPDILVVEGSLAGLRTADAMAIVERLRQEFGGRTLIVDLPEDATPTGFDFVITFENGRLTGAAPPQSAAGG
ncbi:MAG TPA: ABC transporter transmembrane domain-containing protein [Beijerinckiaceae bacterium]|nr:ABC transporter transmembrane domain-containing protein [Beijerinckiaceae bacterium]